jgi:hypothetical protein
MRVLWSCTLVASLALALLPTPAEARPCRLGSRAGARCGLEQPIPQYAQPRGLPALIVGISLFTFAIPPMFIGTRLVVAPDAGRSEWPYAAGPHSAYNMLMTGVVMAAIGIPLTAVGAVRLDRYLRWKRQWTLAPAAGRTPGGGYVGLTLRF